jgi:hypothetical protein
LRGGRRLPAPPARKSIAEVQQSLDPGNPHVAGFGIPTTVTVRAKVERERHTAYNIAGDLAANGRPVAEKPWLGLGAHDDHLGHGENGSSLASREEAGPHTRRRRRQRVGRRRGEDRVATDLNVINMTIDDNVFIYCLSRSERNTNQVSHFESVTCVTSRLEIRRNLCSFIGQYRTLSTEIYSPN